MLIGWVLSFGSGAELLEPEGVRQMLFEEVQELWEYYAQEEGGGER